MRSVLKIAESHTPVMGSLVASLETQVNFKATPGN